MIDISNILRYHRGNAITKATQLKRAAIPTMSQEIPQQTNNGGAAIELEGQ
jgi:hypothetical protein